MKLLKFTDFIILLINLAVIGIFAAMVYGGDISETMVRIESDGEAWLYPLDIDRTVRIPGYRGETVVEIREQRVRVLDSPCPDEICMGIGWLEHQYEWAACLPNGVLVSIEGGEDAGIDTFSR